MGKILVLILQVVIAVTLVRTGYGEYPFGDYDDLDTLGQRIEDSVNAQVASSLGYWPITQTNHGGDIPVNNVFNGQLSRNLQNNIQKNINNLNNLGQQITQNVQQSLEPVRALEIQSRMRNGVGGVTVATYLPSGVTFIIQNFKPYKCSGSVIQQTGQCQGNLIPYQFSTSHDDICFMTSYAVINDKLCFGTGGVSVSIINDVVYCRSTDGSTVVQISKSDYDQKCADKSKEVKYTYIPNTADISHVNIPSPNKYVKCENNTPGRCEFTESHLVGASEVLNGVGSTHFAFQRNL